MTNKKMQENPSTAINKQSTHWKMAKTYMEMKPENNQHYEQHVWGQKSPVISKHGLIRSPQIRPNPFKKPYSGMTRHLYKLKNHIHLVLSYSTQSFSTVVVSVTTDAVTLKCRGLGLMNSV